MDSLSLVHPAPPEHPNSQLDYVRGMQDLPALSRRGAAIINALTQAELASVSVTSRGPSKDARRLDPALSGVGYYVHRWSAYLHSCEYQRGWPMATRLAEVFGEGDLRVGWALLAQVDAAPALRTNVLVEAVAVGGGLSSAAVPIKLSALVASRTNGGRL